MFFFSIINRYQYRYVIQFSVSVSVSVRLKFSKSVRIGIGKNRFKVNRSIPSSISPIVAQWENLGHISNLSGWEDTVRVKISADATNYETDSESLKNIRLANDRIEDEASTDFSEISEDEIQTGNTLRSLRTSHPDDWLSDEKVDEIIHKVNKLGKQ